MPYYGLVAIDATRRSSGAGRGCRGVLEIWSANLPKYTSRKFNFKEPLSLKLFQIVCLSCNSDNATELMTITKRIFCFFFCFPAHTIVDDGNKQISVGHCSSKLKKPKCLPFSKTRKAKNFIRKQPKRPKATRGPDTWLPKLLISRFNQCSKTNINDEHMQHNLPHRMLQGKKVLLQTLTTEHLLWQIPSPPIHPLVS